MVASGGQRLFYRDRHGHLATDCTRRPDEAPADGENYIPFSSLEREREPGSTSGCQQRREDPASRSGTLIATASRDHDH